MSLILSKIVTQHSEQSVDVTCNLSGELSLQAAIYAPPRLLQGFHPTPRTFLYLSYLVALRQQMPLVVECDVSRFEWLNFIHNFIPLLSSFYSLPPVPASLAGVTTEHPAPPMRRGGIGLMFSCGVDSFHTLLGLQKEKLKPDCLVSINAGAFPHNGVWKAALPYLGSVSHAYQIPLILIDTNFHRAFPRPHLASHTVRNITAAMLLKPWLSTAFYSSSTTLVDAIFPRAREIQDISSIETMVLYAMQQSDFGTLVYGLNTERIEKTREIHRDPIVQRHLNVCTNWKYQLAPQKVVINCGQCSKCARTMFTLEALGSLEHYGRSFDLTEFARNRSALLEKLRQSHYRIDQTVVELVGTR